MDSKLQASSRETENRPFGHGEEPAVKRRVGHFGDRLPAQHRQLDEFFATVIRAMERGSLIAARAVFTRFRDALEAHISLEDRLIFPALRALHPRITSELVRLVEDHDGFRSRLEELSDLLVEGSVEEFCGAFDRLAVVFSQHEEREERLMAKPAGESADSLDS